MKSVIVGTQTTLQPTVLAQYGTGLGEFKFSGFGVGGILIMQVAPRYRIEIIDCWAKGNATPVNPENIVIEKVNAAGVALPVATLTFLGGLLETVRYTVATAAAVLANFTIDPALGEFIRVTGTEPGITGGATITILFNLV
jgi:hypothetical protein